MVGKEVEELFEDQHALFRLRDDLQSFCHSRLFENTIEKVGSLFKLGSVIGGVIEWILICQGKERLSLSLSLLLVTVLVAL